MSEPIAWILTIGNEILIGRIVNTNASWLAERLTFLGFHVERIIVVPDDVDHIVEELGRALRRARLVITTGGLGPTYDDRTLEGVARATGRALRLDERAREMIQKFYSERGLPLTEDRLKMAMLPEGSEPLPNPVGAAPGMWLEHDNTIIVSLPGVPDEMKSIFTKYVEPRLRSLAPRRAVHECGFTVKGVPESSLAPYLKKAARRYPHAYIKSHPKGHETHNPVLDIRVLASGASKEEAAKLCEEILMYLEDAVKNLGGVIVERYSKGAD